jgi:hypothetical protein
MTITYPRELPEVLFTTVDLVLNDGITATASRGRLTNYTQHSPPLWGVSLTTQPLTDDQFAEIEAWVLSLRGGLKPALFRHPAQQYPRKHVADQTPAEDTGALVSVTSGNVLNVSGVSEDLQLSTGDLLGLERAGKLGYFRITSVTGTGTTRAITVEPPPYATVSQAGAVVRFIAPAMTMRLIPSTYSAQRNGALYTVTFKMMEM